MTYGNISKLARRLGVSRTHLSRILNHSQRPSIDLALRIVQALREVSGIDISVEELVRRPGDPAWPIDIRYVACDPPAEELAVMRELVLRAQARGSPPHVNGGDPGHDGAEPAERASA